MTVYVDDMHKWSMGHFGRMKMSHMIADTENELHKMAKAIGVARKHFQDKSSSPHYDIAKSKRALALQKGAVAITLRQCSRMCFMRRVEGGKLPTPKKVDSAWNQLQRDLLAQAERQHARRDFLRARQEGREKPKIKRLRLRTGDEDGRPKRCRNAIPKMRLDEDRKKIKRLSLAPASVSTNRRNLDPVPSTKKRSSGFF